MVKSVRVAAVRSAVGLAFDRNGGARLRSERGAPPFRSNDFKKIGRSAVGLAFDRNGGARLRSERGGPPFRSNDFKKNRSFGRRASI